MRNVLALCSGRMKFEPIQQPLPLPLVAVVQIPTAFLTVFKKGFRAVSGQEHVTWPGQCVSFSPNVVSFIYSWVLGGCYRSRIDSERT